MEQRRGRKKKQRGEKKRLLITRYLCPGFIKKKKKGGDCTAGCRRGSFFSTKEKREKTRQKPTAEVASKTPVTTGTKGDEFFAVTFWGKIPLLRYTARRSEKKSGSRGKGRLSMGFRGDRTQIPYVQPGESGSPTEGKQGKKVSASKQ